MLEATSLGLGSIWLMHWNPDKMKVEFQIPEHYEPVALLIFGYPEDVAPHKEHFKRKSIEDIVF